MANMVNIIRHHQTFKSQMGISLEPHTYNVIENFELFVLCTSTNRKVCCSCYTYFKQTSGIFCAIHKQAGFQTGHLTKAVVSITYCKILRTSSSVPPPSDVIHLPLR